MRSPPAEPSMRAWWTLVTRATVPSAKPSTSQVCHRGTSRRSGVAHTSPTKRSRSSRPASGPRRWNRRWLPRSNSSSSIHRGWSSPAGTSTSRRRNGGIRCSRSLYSWTSRSRENSPSAVDGSSTSTPTTWRCMVGDSSSRKAASIPLTRSTIAAPPAAQPARVTSGGVRLLCPWPSGSRPCRWAIVRCGRPARAAWGACSWRGSGGHGLEGRRGRVSGRAGPGPPR